MMASIASNGKPDLAAIRLHVDAFGQLVLTDAAGRVHVGVVPVRAFPLSDPQQWLAFCDSQGREILIVEDPEQLSPEARGVVETELAGREFLPVIQRINHVSGTSEPCQWEVETDRGPTTFVLKSEDDIRRIGPHRALITDADGVRYLVPDARRMDAFSRRKMEWYL